jgi:hypothetical protein
VEAFLGTFFGNALLVLGVGQLGSGEAFVTEGSEDFRMELAGGFEGAEEGVHVAGAAFHAEFQILILEAEDALGLVFPVFGWSE